MGRSSETHVSNAASQAPEKRDYDDYHDGSLDAGVSNRLEHDNRHPSLERHLELVILALVSC